MELSYTADRFKIAIKWLGAILAGLAGLWVLWLLILFFFSIIFPPQPPGPNLAFGKLASPFENNAPSNINYDIEIPGGIGAFAKTLSVYSIPSQQGQLNSLDQAKLKARNAGLLSDPIKLSDTKWRWTNPKNTNQVLDLDIVSNNFTFKYDWITDPSALDGVFTTTDEDTIRDAKNTLKQFDALTDDLNTGEQKIKFFKLTGNQEIPVGSYSEANAVEVHFFRDKLDGKFPIVEASTSQSLVNVRLSPSTKSDKKLLAINYTYWDVDLKNQGTYPAKTPDSALTDLKNGRAFLAAGKGTGLTDVTISKVFLAYFNAPIYFPYMQPVYVFGGGGLVNGTHQDFTAYVPAIDSSYITN